jgi:putative transposase
MWLSARSWAHSLTVPPAPGGATLQDTSLDVCKSGTITCIVQEGTPKTVTIRRTSTGKWFVTMCCEWALPPTGNEVGMDGGLPPVAPRSAGQESVHPRFFRQEEAA